MSGHRIIIIFAIFLSARVETGRLVQEDPLSNKGFPNKPLVQDAPTNFVARKPLLQHGVTLVTTTSRSVSSRDLIATSPKMEVVTRTTPRGRKKRKFLTSSNGYSPGQSKSRMEQNEILGHRLRRKNIAEYQKEDTSNVLQSSDPNSLLDMAKQLDTDYDEMGVVNRRLKRGFRVWTTYPPHVLLLDRFFFRSPPTTPKFAYGKCFVSYGYDDNPNCVSGEVCVDKDTLNKVECPNGGPKGTCQPCQPQAPPPTCPKGCEPDASCPIVPGPEDGLCVDPVLDDTEYDLTGLETTPTMRTPMVFYPGTLGKGASCSVYGDLVFETQKSAMEFVEKSKKLKSKSDAGSYGGSMCNWAQARLECIPDAPRRSTTTLPGTMLTEADIEASKRPSGTCQCMLALGDEAVAVEDENTGNKICYIPANKGQHSRCDHSIYPPHGAIEGVRRDGNSFYRLREPASKFCTPNSECRPGYKYTGLRCQCTEKAIWDPKTATCSRATGMLKNSLMKTAAVRITIIYSMIRTLQNF